MARVATSLGWSRNWQAFDPFKAIFRLLTSVRFALLLIGLVAVGALCGVVFPQATDDVRAFPASYDAFTEFQRGKYGVFTTALRRLDLFAVFHSYWFNGLVLVLLLSVAVCTASRMTPIVRNALHPVRRVNDRYFVRAHHRAEFATPEDPSRIARELRRRHYRVQETQRDGAIFLFADRFPWATFGTFSSHLALILFMSGAIVTKLVGFSTFINIPEGGTYPVFPTIHAGQMQVANVHSQEDLDAQGNIKQYVSHLAVYRNGKQVCAGTSTVNDPMHCVGYVFHQTAFSPDGVALQVRDLSTGQLIYTEVENLGTQGSAPNPHLQVRDAGGATLFDDNVVLAPGLTGQTDQWYAILPIKQADGNPAQPLVLVLSALQSGKEWLMHLHISGTQPGDDGYDTVLLPSQTATAGGYNFAIPDLSGIPISVVQGVPGMASAALLQLAKSANGQTYLDVIDMGDGGGQLGIGTGDTPSPAGQATSDNAPAGAPPAAGRMDLIPGAPLQAGGYEYTFVGARSITGITVRKDPGSTFIWVATALMLFGLGVTFYVPRRRMWVRIADGRTQMAGVADRIVDFAAEMRRIGAAAGSADALSLTPEEED